MAKNIVIAGAGYGGLRVALDLAGYLDQHGLKKDHQIFLVDRNEHHVFTPLLYKLAARYAYPEEALAYPIKKIVEPHGIKFVQDEIKELDLLNGDIHLSRGEELTSDYLVLAPGSESNYFNIEGLKENSLPLKTLKDARTICDRLAVLSPSAHVIVGGGGPTGIELAAEIRKTHGFRVSIVEATPTLLPGFDPRLPKLAMKRLNRLGVQVFTNTMIAKTDPQSITSKDGQQITFDLLIWTGGVKPPGWISGLPIKIEERGRIEAAASMQCLPRSEDLSIVPMVYALGDAVCVYGKDGKPMPGVAPAAIEQGKIVAANILTDILSSQGQSGTRKNYVPAHYPYVLPIGGGYSIGTIGLLYLRGWVASTFEKFVALDYWLSILPVGAALKVWLKD